MRRKLCTRYFDVVTQASNELDKKWHEIIEKSGQSLFGAKIYSNKSVIDAFWPVARHLLIRI